MGFKKPSEKARRHGNSRLLLEDMIKRAERKIEEKKRAGLVSATSRKKAEVLAEELFHTPGTLLSQEEFAHMYLESGCEELNSFNGNCFRQPFTFSFRSIDGTCNNLFKPLQGASGTAFRRLTPALYEDGRGTLRGTFQALNFPEEEEAEDLPQILKIGPFVPPSPSARLVSKAIVTNSSENETPFTHILMQWGQFLDHDLSLGPELEEECEECIFTDICRPIRVTKDDPTFGLGTPQNGECLPFRRAVPVCNTDTPGSFSPREQINDLTSYIDGSMVYGSNSFVGNAVREPYSPLLRTGPEIPPHSGLDSLPIDDQGIVACLGRDPPDCFLCGDIRCNEQVSLSVMHTLWVREHNRIVGGLRRINPQWSNERTFQEARKIVGALIQKITYIDYLPKVMGPEIFDETIGPYIGYDISVDASVPNSFATAAYRYGHSLIRPMFDRLRSNFEPLNIGSLSLAEMFFRPDQFRASGGSDPIARGWVTQTPRRMDEFLNLVLTSRLFSSNGDIGMDLASLNIQRQRDHGMADYGTWRTFCQGVFPELLEETPDLENQYTFLKFLQLYGRVEGADLWVAGISERRLPYSLLGPTFACLFGLTFRNVRDGDRFYYERPGVFTSGQLAVIRKQTLSRVLCDTTNIDHIQPDAFLGNQDRVSCDSLPPLDLREWKEQECYARISGNFVSGQRVIAAVKSNTGYLPILYFTNDDNPSCLAFRCPSSSSSIALYAFPLINDLTACTITTTLDNTPIPSEPASVFVRFITSNDITQFKGLYRDRASCARSSTTAITWSCPTVPQPLASSQGDDDCDPYDKDCISSPEGLGKLTDGLELDDIQMQSSDSIEDYSDSPDTVAESNTVSNQDLLAELQEVMKNLN